ncbi:hypothetical protein PPYR_01186 [Photinus pyralis]|uniref:von Hippel-Lindau disease tumour suppressor beta domain-containing protein n=1 Tax=Photinus pyralis TaxID=7054 RepID=A0A1Y1LJC0_PHOPY|nr:von Hippel-Lindau tumor suppressor homolog [Photinus pyralis]KAB0804216.1 hypothetical protein PPYR_01186 [Photinus pyralis]
MDDGERSADDQGNLVRSVDSHHPSYIRVTNLCPEAVDLIWIDYQGRHVKYTKLSNRAFVDVNTFETHPWIAVHSDKKDKVLMNNKFIYMPTRSRPVPNLPADAPLQFLRVSVSITLPVYSLRYRALLEIRSYLTTVSDVDTLDLPAELRNALKVTILDRISLTQNLLQRI